VGVDSHDGEWAIYGDIGKWASTGPLVSDSPTLRPQSLCERLKSFGPIW
jgi:hypothetical protein